MNSNAVFKAARFLHLDTIVKVDCSITNTNIILFYHEKHIRDIIIQDKKLSSL